MLRDIIKKLVGRPLIWLGEHYPATLVRLRYLARFHRLPDLQNPKDLNEKILWLKLYSDTSEWTRLADKLRVRDYVRERGLEDILVPLYGAWERVEDIPFDTLPSQFILKANNGDGKGTNIKVDKSKMTDADWIRLREMLQEWLSRKHVGALAAEPQYRNIKPMILAEQQLPAPEGESSLVDYKLWCFGGEPYSFLVCSNRKENGYDTNLGCYDLDWNYHPEHIQASKRYPLETQPLPRPQCLEEMIRVARVLANGFPEVRVDLYESQGCVWFGELTFTSLCGMMNYYTPRYLREMGAQLRCE
ncbi:MAG: hypothetical protein IJV36_05495 [Prevotella sp.]|nr:hypothetical protein [Prevotella sp.]